MEDLLTNAFNTGDLKVIVVAAILYLIIYFQRKDTSKKRDEDADAMDKRVTILEHDCEFMKQQHSLFADKLDKILNELCNIKIELAKKEEKK